MRSLTQLFQNPAYRDFKKDKIFVYCDLIDFVSKFHAFDMAAVSAAEQHIQGTTDSDKSSSIQKFMKSRDTHKDLLDKHISSLKDELDQDQGRYGELKTKILRVLDRITDE